VGSLLVVLTVAVVLLVLGLVLVPGLVVARRANRQTLTFAEAVRRVEASCRPAPFRWRRPMVRCGCTGAEAVDSWTGPAASRRAAPDLAADRVTTPALPLFLQAEVYLVLPIDEAAKGTWVGSGWCLGRWDRARRRDIGRSRLPRLVG
jgi:hypothetical protein